MALGAWQSRLAAPSAVGVLRLLLWFPWPVWPLALWTLWCWRRHWLRRHIAVPLATVVVGVASAVAMGGSERALMLALPGMAVMAAFALPTLKRSAAAAVDWFSVFFFSLAALTVWVIYLSMQTGVPAKPMANIMRLAPGFVPRFSMVELMAAAIGTLAWLWLVRWRTSRHRHPLWKSLVLSASGVALAWLLTMTLLLPVLDYARSPRALVALLDRHIPQGACVLAPGMTRANVAALEVFGDHRVVTLPERSLPPDCRRHLVVAWRGSTPPLPPAGWTLEAHLRRPGERSDQLLVYRPAP
jgi:4-amino-4-deoxy-L-arabinose transferase-like glycosyltransferase